MARRHGLAFEEKCGLGRRDFLLVILLDELNGVLYELHFESLPHPTQEIRGERVAHTVLVEQFSTLTWVCSNEDD